MFIDRKHEQTSDLSFPFMLCIRPGTWPVISTSAMQLQPDPPFHTFCHSLHSPGWPPPGYHWCL